MKEDQVVGETTAPESGEPEATRRSSADVTGRLLEKVEGSNGRGRSDDVLAAAERARQAQEREPVRFVIEPENAEGVVTERAT
jgi:hypothetical protein